MKKRIVAIAAVVFLVAAFVFMAVPVGAVIAVPYGFINELSSSSLLTSSSLSGAFSGDDFTRIDLYLGAGMVGNMVSDGVVLWFLVESFSNMPQSFDVELLFGHFGSNYCPPYPRRNLILDSREFVSLDGITYDLYSYTYSSSDWNAIIGGVYPPNTCSLYVTGTDGIASVDTSWYFGINTVSDFYGAFFNAGMVDQSAGYYQGIYAGADWKLRINLNVTYEGENFWETDIDPVPQNGYIDVDTAYSDALQRFYSETNLGGLNIVSVLIQCYFYSPYELGLGLIQTSGSVDSSVSLELLTANGNPYNMNAIEDGGWVKWDNSNVSRLQQFVSFRYLVPVAFAHDSLRFYTSGAEFDAGYNFGYDDGFSNGEDIGYAAGEETGYADGKQDGMQEGFDSGYSQGVSTGKELGYSIGYSEGLQVAESGSFYSLISAVVDAPIQAFLGLLTFEFLGVNLANFFLSIVSAFFALKIYKIIKSV